MATALAIQAPILVPGIAAAERMQLAPDSIMPIARAPFGPSRGPLVTALVTIAIMAWFSAVLVTMMGELHGIPTAPSTQPEAAGDMPAGLPQASTGPATFVHARMSLI